MQIRATLNGPVGIKMYNIALLGVTFVLVMLFEMEKSAKASRVDPATALWMQQPQFISRLSQILANWTSLIITFKFFVTMGPTASGHPFVPLSQPISPGRCDPCFPAVPL